MIVTEDSNMGGRGRNIERKTKLKESELKNLIIFLSNIGYQAIVFVKSK